MIRVRAGLEQGYQKRFGPCRALLLAVIGVRYGEEEWGVAQLARLVQVAAGIDELSEALGQSTESSVVKKNR